MLEAYVSAWNRHDFGAFDKLLAPDAIHEDIAWPFRGQGPAQIKDFMRVVIQGQPDLSWHLTTVVETGPLVAAEWTWTSTYTGDTPSGPVVGKRISAGGASVAVIENGRIKRFTDYYDMASAFRELPTGGSATDPYTTTNNGDEAARRVWYDRWAKVFEAHDIEGIIANYAPGDAVVAHEVVAPLQYKKDTYRKDYLEFLAPVRWPNPGGVRDMRVLSSGDVGFIHLLERFTGRLKNGQQSDLWLRATSGVLKVNGKFLIVHDHGSVPIDFETGKAVAKP